MKTQKSIDKMNQVLDEHTTFNFSTREELLRSVTFSKQCGIDNISMGCIYPDKEVLRQSTYNNHRIEVIGLIAGIIGASLAFYFQYWVNMHAYPINFGGKPQFAWASFIPVCFEFGILSAAIAMVFVFFKQSKLAPGKQKKNIKNYHMTIRTNDIEKYEYPSVPNHNKHPETVTEGANF